MICLYVAGMSAVYGSTFLDASGVQVRRASGIWESRGSVGGLGEALGPLVSQYRIFYGTIAVALVGMGMLAFRVARAVFSRDPGWIRGNSLVFSWLVAGVVFFSAVQIRFPQYFMMILLPLYLFVAVNVRDFLRSRGGTAGAVVVAAAFALAAAHAFTFVDRLVLRHDNALQAVAGYARNEIPRSSVVMTEEPIGVLIPQPYCESWQAPACRDRAGWLILYETALFEPQNAELVESMVERGERRATFVGFKETITVYRLPDR
jgi:hypothetical protein